MRSQARHNRADNESAPAALCRNRLHKFADRRPDNLAWPFWSHTGGKPRPIMVQMVMARRDAVEHAMPYFRELVESALAHQRLTATEETAFYLVHLLASFLQPNIDTDGEPLGVRFAKALDSVGPRQREGLKAIGDESLFVSGFFSDSLGRRMVDIDYCVTVGGAAYNALSRLETDVFSPVFDELARKFVAFVDVLNEVSERTSCTSNADLLRLYEKWLRTGSRRSGQLLIAKGVIPGPPGPPRIQ